MCFYSFMFLDVKSNYKSDNVDKRQFIDSILQDCGFNFGPELVKKWSNVRIQKLVEIWIILLNMAWVQGRQSVSLDARVRCSDGQGLRASGIPAPTEWAVLLLLCHLTLPLTPEAEPFYPLTASLYSSPLLTESIALLICVKWWGDCRNDQRFRVDGAVDSTSDVDRWERLYPRHGHHSLRGCHHL